MKKMLRTSAILAAVLTLSACGSTASSVADPSAAATSSAGSALSSAATSSAGSASSQAGSISSSAGRGSSSSTGSNSGIGGSPENEISGEASSESNAVPDSSKAYTSTDADHFPSFSVKDLEDNTVTDAIFAEAKLTLVNVWGTFCGPCIGEMPSLGELAAELKSEGLQVLGIVCDVADFYTGEVYQGQDEAAKEIVEKTGAAYTHIIPTAEFEKILGEAMYIPMTFFVDSTGRILGEPLVGSRSKEEWKNIIMEKLAGVNSNAVRE